MKHERDYMDIRTYPPAPESMSESIADIMADTTLALINEKAMLRRTVQSLEAQKGELLASIRQQDAEIQSLRAEVSRLAALLQAGCAL